MRNITRLSWRHTVRAYRFLHRLPLAAENGVKLRKDEIRASGKRGWLTFAKMRVGQPVWTAKLTGPHGGNILPELCYANVKAISRGILISGLIVRHTQAQPERQTWYCEPIEDGGRYTSARRSPSGGPSWLA